MSYDTHARASQNFNEPIEPIEKAWSRLGSFWRPPFDTHEPTHGASASVDAYFNFLAYHFFVPITIEFPDLALQTGFNLTRWTEILADPSLAKVPDRIETDRHGHILMTPPSGLRHSERQGQIIGLLIQFAPLADIFRRVFICLWDTLNFVRQHAAAKKCLNKCGGC